MTDRDSNCRFGVAVFFNGLMVVMLTISVYIWLCCNVLSVLLFIDAIIKSTLSFYR